MTLHVACLVASVARSPGGASLLSFTEPCCDTKDLQSLVTKTRNHYKMGWWGEGGKSI